jgi:serine/threonine-protein kinase
MDAEAEVETIGRYCILRQLGQGAMGRVLLAKDPVLDREVAIKLLRDDLKIPSDQKAALVKRMRQEARASARVSHPNIVALHDMGEAPARGLYLVFEYAKGTTLKERLEQAPLKPALAARLARELGSALTTAHQAGVLHRDIKPDNIILSATGAKIADFGIARVPDSTLTRDGGLLGTPAYSSPESIASGTFSPLSDQFSMAATLYEAVAGIRAFPGQDAVAVATKISTQAPLPVAASRGLGPRVDEVLTRALSKDASRRFTSALEFGEAFAGALEESIPRRTMATIPDQRHAAQTLPPRRSGVLRAALGGAALGALAAVAAFQLSSRMKVSDIRESSNIAPAVSLFATPSMHRPPTPVGWLAESPPKPRRKQHPSLAGSREAARESNSAFPPENGRGRSPANLDDDKAQHQPQPLKGNPQSDRPNQDGFVEDE